MGKLNEIPLTIGSYSDDGVDMNAQECENLYWRIDKEGGRSSMAPTPGTKILCDLTAAT